jgi:hypothetical protein
MSPSELRRLLHEVLAEVEQRLAGELLSEAQDAAEAIAGEDATLARNLSRELARFARELERIAIDSFRDAIDDRVVALELHVPAAVSP